MSIERAGYPVEHLPTQLDRLVVDPGVAHIIYGKFRSDPEFQQFTGNGHGIVKEVRGENPNLTQGIRRFIEGEVIFSRLLKLGLYGKSMATQPEFTGYLVGWGDEQKDVLSLVYPDRQEDTRFDSHTAYHVVAPKGSLADTIELLREDPQSSVALLHRVFPSGDRSARIGKKVTVADFIELGDIATPKQQPEQTIMAPIKPRSKSWLGRLGLRG